MTEAEALAWFQSHWVGAGISLATIVTMRLMYWAGIRKGREAEHLDGLKRKLKAMEPK